MGKRHYDYIIIGSGSAGSVLASRLTEDSDIAVGVFEAGPSDGSWELRMPAAFSRPLNSTRFNWAYRTQPEPYMNGRVLDCPRGRVIGGSSSINGMCYIRGHAADYDRWAEETGDPTWSYAHCLPYFRKSEVRGRGPDDYHGGDGPLYVNTPAADNPLFQAFIDGRSPGWLSADGRSKRILSGRVRDYGYDSSRRCALECGERISAPGFKKTES